MWRVRQIVQHRPNPRPLDGANRRGETMLTNTIWPRFLERLSVVVIATCLAVFSLSGCERKERVLDVQTPGADIEVDRNIDTGEIEVDVEED
jgi:hypothetical protein